MEEDDVKNSSFIDNNDDENERQSNSANSQSNTDNIHELDYLKENIEKMNENLFQLELKQLKLKTSIANLKFNEDDLSLKTKEMNITWNSYNISFKILIFISIVGILSGSYFNKMIQTLIK